MQARTQHHEQPVNLTELRAHANVGHAMLALMMVAGSMATENRFSVADIWGSSPNLTAFPPQVFTTDFQEYCVAGTRGSSPIPDGLPTLGARNVFSV